MAIVATLELDPILRGRSEERNEECKTVEEAREWVRSKFFDRWGHSVKSARIHQTGGLGYWVVRPYPHYTGRYPADIREHFVKY